MGEIAFTRHHETKDECSKDLVDADLKSHPGRAVHATYDEGQKEGVDVLIELPFTTYPTKYISEHHKAKYDVGNSHDGGVGSAFIIGGLDQGDHEGKETPCYHIVTCSDCHNDDL